jgi:hypothetical protein
MKRSNHFQDLQIPGIFLEVKSGWHVRLTTCELTVLKMLEPQHLTTL